MFLIEDKSTIHAIIKKVAETDNYFFGRWLFIKDFLQFCDSDGAFFTKL